MTLESDPISAASHGLQRQEFYMDSPISCLLFLSSPPHAQIRSDHETDQRESEKKETVPARRRLAREQSRRLSRKLLWSIMTRTENVNATQLLRRMAIKSLPSTQNAMWRGGDVNEDPMICGGFGSERQIMTERRVNCSSKVSFWIKLRQLREMPN
jgi:hypothetical protein